MRISLIELPETVRDNSRTSLSNSSSLVEDISIPFRIFKNKIKIKKEKPIIQRIYFRFFTKIWRKFQTYRPTANRRK